jgi:hypothetical protein
MSNEIVTFKQLFINLFKNFKFAYFFAFYLATYLLTIYLFAIIMPERVANNPIVTQFTTMAANLLSFLVGFFFGGVAEKAKPIITQTGNNPTATANPNTDEKN